MRNKSTKMLKKYRSIGEFYSYVGDEGYGKLAGYLLRLMVVSPIIAGIINFIMLLQITYYYDAYEYNHRFMIVSNTIFILITLCFCTYIVGKMRYNKWYVENVLVILYQREPWLLFWICLLIWGLFSSLASCSIRGALFGGTELSGCYMSHVFMLCVMGCAYIANDEERRKIIRLYIVVSDILVIVMLAFEYDIPFISGFTAASGCSVFTNSNHYGYYIAVASLCFAGMYFLETEKKAKQDRKNTYIYIGSFTVHMWALMLNDTLGAYFGVIFGIAGLMIMWKMRTGKLGMIRWIPVFIVIGFTFLSYVGMMNSKLGSSIGASLIVFIGDVFSVTHKTQGYEQAGTNRIALWKETIDAIKLNPILGYGPDLMYDRWYRPVISLTPHNEYLECAFYMGIPGGILYLSGLIGLFISRLKRIKGIPLHMIVSGATVISYLVSAFFGVRKYHTVNYLFMFLGFLIIRKKDKVDNKQE